MRHPQKQVYRRCHRCNWFELVSLIYRATNLLVSEMDTKKEAQNIETSLLEALAQEPPSSAA